MSKQVDFILECSSQKKKKAMEIEIIVKSLSSSLIIAEIN